MLTVDPHPLLDALAFTTEFPAALGEIKLPDWLGALLSADATSESAPLHAAVPPALRVPLRSSDEVRSEVRDLLRHGGYKPTGRGKPASEYLIRAVSEGALSPINAAVDVCNIVSLHGGLPISVIDLDRAQSPFRIGVAPPGESYVFNASGQTIDLEGLLCLFDAEGPCANAVKDAQRTKTSPATRRTLSVVWGCKRLPGRCAQAVAWYRALLHELSARTEALEASAGA